MYGWYPAANDVWKTYRTKKDTYQDEYLSKQYHHRDEDYPSVPPMTSSKLHLSPRPHRSYTAPFQGQRSHTASVRSDTSRPPSELVITSVRPPPPTPNNKVTTHAFSPSPPSGSRCGSAFSASRGPAGMRSGSAARPGSTPTCRSRKAWSTYVPETPVTPNPNLTATLRPETGFSGRSEGQKSPDGYRYHPGSGPDRRGNDPDVERCHSGYGRPGTSASERRVRVRSATVCRPKTGPPKRPVQSAGPSRKQPSESYEPYRDDVTVASPAPHVIPTAYTAYTEPAREAPEKPFNYDEELKKHGWKMEIPGDPLNLKRACIDERLSYTVEVKPTRIPDDPPRAKMESNETFFYNTIPRQPLSFVIHKDWLSEVLHAKRLQLQKRQGDAYVYRQKDFAFIY